MWPLGCPFPFLESELAQSLSSARSSLVPTPPLESELAHSPSLAKLSLFPFPLPSKYICLRYKHSKDPPLPVGSRLAGPMPEGCFTVH